MNDKNGLERTTQMKSHFFEKKKYFHFPICVMFFALFNVFWFKKIGGKVFLIGDDVRFFNYIKVSDHVLKTVFTNEIGTYRPVPYFFLMIFVRVFGTSSSFYFYANLVLNFIIMVSIFIVSYHLCNKNLLLSFSAPIFYVTAIYSYYGITQMLGFMELMCLLWAVWFFYFLMKFLESKSSRYYLFSVIVYFFITFSHERFLVFFGVYVVLNLFVLQDERIVPRLGRLLVSAVPAAVFLFLKLYVFKVPLLVGTGQIQIKFNIFSTLKYTCQSVLSIFGINCGPKYLFGFNFSEYRLEQKIAILLVAATAILLFFLYVFQKILKDATGRRMEIQKMLLFIFTEGAAILCYAVSSRIEMRELYVPYTLLVLYAVYCAGKIKMRRFQRLILLAAALIVTTANHAIYQAHVGELFFMEAMRLGKSAYEAVCSLEELALCKIYIPNQGDLVWALLLTDQRDIFYMHDMVVEYELYEESENMFEKLQGNIPEEKAVYVIYLENNMVNMQQAMDLTGLTGQL